FTPKTLFCVIDVQKKRVHCLWSCPYVRDFWKQVVVFLQDILNISIPLVPKLFLLGILPDNLIIGCGKLCMAFFFTCTSQITSILTHTYEIIVFF
uniref:Uncharacterized protein n=1 Tax=Neogobius melanostomus TaxID=47308 RepID=A0A8C6UBJ2_9GOBI